MPDSIWTKITSNRATWPPDKEPITLTYEVKGDRKFKTSWRVASGESGYSTYPNILGINTAAVNYYWTFPKFNLLGGK